MFSVLALPKIKTMFGAGRVLKLQFVQRLYQAPIDESLVKEYAPDEIPRGRGRGRGKGQQFPKR